MFKVGQEIHGFVMEQEEEIGELNGISRIFKHKQSGARVMYLSTEDDNKVFSITFRTPPTDNTGLPHILEHSVLCGSRKYPVKDPFVELAKGSLNTFLNAMTFSDKTMYPIASTNDQDFLNLADVYLDAVFHPNIGKQPEILKQEGWHYEIHEAEDPITYKGVVYNEMKGAFSSPEQVLMRKIQQSLFPDTPYALESGGDPDFIPQLTQEDFTAFHKKYYHPSNSYIFFYGNGDVSKHLTWLDEEYLSEYRVIDVDSEIPVQKKFAEPVKMLEEYPIASTDEEKDKTYLSYNFAVGERVGAEVYYALEILEYLLLEAQGAPLKKALLDAGICKDVFGVCDNGILQPTVSIIAKNANAEDEERFTEIIQGTLQGLIQKGIDKKQVEAAINRFEFKLREADFGRYPKGITYGIQSLDSWLYDGDPNEYLRYEPAFEKIKSALQTPYFEKMIEEHFLGNSHRTIVTLIPKKGLNAQREKELEEELLKFKESLSKEELKKLLQQTADLEEYQVEPNEPEDLEKIPLLKLEDIRKEVQKIKISEKEIETIPVLFHEDLTNGIAYFRFAFNLESIEEELIPYVGLLARVLGKVDTEGYNYTELSNEINIHTGGIRSYVNAYSQYEEPEKNFPKLLITGKALYGKVNELIQLFKEILQGSSFGDHQRMKEILSEILSRMEMHLMSNGHIAAAARCQSNFSLTAKWTDLTSGVAFYRFLKNIMSQYEEKIPSVAKTLETLLENLIHQNNLLVCVSCEDEQKEFLEKGVNSFVKDIPHGSSIKAKKGIQPVGKNEGLLSSGKIQYVAKAGNFIRQGFSHSGNLKVLQTIMSLDYLWKKIRIQGGAYGCMINFYRNGDMYVTSYRDPNLKGTLKVYDEMEKYIADFHCDEREMIKYIIGTISKMDTPLTPSMAGDRALANYISRVSDGILQKERDEVLSTTPEAIRSLAELMKACMEENHICVFGNEDTIRKNKEIFDELIEVFQ